MNDARICLRQPAAIALLLAAPHVTAGEPVQSVGGEEHQIELLTPGHALGGVHSADGLDLDEGQPPVRCRRGQVGEDLTRRHGGDGSHTAASNDSASTSLVPVAL